MKYLRKLFLSLVAVFVLIVTNPGVFALQAYAWDTWTNSPAWSKPGWSTPPEWDEPKWSNPPEWQEPSWDSPPEWNSEPGWDTPPEWNNAPKWENSPWVTPPEWNTDPGSSRDGPGKNPSGNGKEQPDPGSPSEYSPQNPGGNNNFIPGPPLNPDYQNPGLETLEDLNQQNNPPAEQTGGQADNGQPDPNKENKPLDPYKVTKYVGDTIINGQVKMIHDAVKDPEKFNVNFPSRTNYLTRVAVNGFKLGFEGSVPADMLLYGHDSADKYFKVKDSLDTLRKARLALNDTSALSPASSSTLETASSVSKMSPLAKLNFATAGISAGFAAVDTYKGFKSIGDAKSGQEKGEAIGTTMASGGDFLMNAGTMMTAIPIPAVQAVGAGVIMVGGALWAAGTATKLISRHWDKITGAAKKVVDFRNKARKKIVDTGVKLAKGVISLFSR
ncbi:MULTISPECIES: hypothetical protein [Bacillaceae]|uniref:hypothetical protein n=1 Tax=Bacillaceae TaxID=186817 RepID=UPI00296485F4|nr:hypothetical protein [Bacillus infantis]MDW2879573.1 hypothetical protein [Bacillus infantis]